MQHDRGQIFAALVHRGRRGRRRAVGGARIDRHAAAAAVVAAVHGRLSKAAEHSVSLQPAARRVFFRGRRGGGERRRRVALPLDEHVADHLARLRVHLEHRVVRHRGLRGRPDSVAVAVARVAVVRTHVHRVGEHDRLLAGDRAAAAVARQRQLLHRCRGHRVVRLLLLLQHARGGQIGNDGRVVFGRRVHAGLLDGVVQQPRAARLQVESQVERVVPVRRHRVRNWLRSVHRELLDHHVPARVRYRRGRRRIVSRTAAAAAVERPVTAVGRLVRSQWQCRAPTELTVPLSFYLVISFLLLLVLVQVV